MRHCPGHYMLLSPQLRVTAASKASRASTDQPIIQMAEENAVRSQFGSPGDCCRSSWSPAFPPCVPARIPSHLMPPSQWRNRQHWAQRAMPSHQKDRVLGVARPTLHVSLLVGSRRSCGQLGTAPKGQEPKEVGSTGPCCLGPLGGHSQTCQPCAVAAPRQ